MTPAQILSKATNLRTVLITQAIALTGWFILDRIVHLGIGLNLGEVVIALAIFEVGVAVTDAAAGIIRAIIFNNYKS